MFATMDLPEYKRKLTVLVESTNILRTSTQRLNVAHCMMKDKLICQKCTKPVLEGYTCVPCCHSFCSDCSGPNMEQCTECKISLYEIKHQINTKNKTVFVYKNKLLSDFNKTFDFIQESMADLIRLADKIDRLKGQDALNLLAAYK